MWNRSDPRRLRVVDLDSQPLPYANKEVDYLYTRHTLEDINEPLHLCREINRVAKAGYIETPSPAAEFCRGVDAGKPPHRGYRHHRYFVWSEATTLFFLPKYPLVEYLHLDEEMENRLVERLNQMPLAWNNYFLWNDEFQFVMLRHDRDFRLPDGYVEAILRGVNHSIQNAVHFAEENNLVGAAFVPNA